jgi:hypothetical protein
MIVNVFLMVVCIFGIMTAGLINVFGEDKDDLTSFIGAVVFSFSLGMIMVEMGVI